MNGIIAVASSELRIAIRNRWVLISIVMMTLFALVLSAAGSAPTGHLGADKLSITVASLTSLAVYLVPLVALLMSFDAIAGEVERGTLPLALAYPISRSEILAGKLLAHLGVLSLAVATGYAIAAVAAFALDDQAARGLPALARLFWTSVFLGAAFLGGGYAISALSRRPGTAAGIAIALWLIAIVLYDLALLAAVVADSGGTFTQSIFPWMLVANPADAFRLFNLSMSEATAAAGGIAGAANSISPDLALVSLMAWPLAAFALAASFFRRVTP
ncbi:MAG: ABC transporter permease [Hyphomicrobiaceae bacterium]